MKNLLILDTTDKARKVGLLTAENFGGIQSKDVDAIVSTAMHYIINNEAIKSLHTICKPCHLFGGMKKI